MYESIPALPYVCIHIHLLIFNEGQKTVMKLLVRLFSLEKTPMARRYWAMAWSGDKATRAWLSQGMKRRKVESIWLDSPHSAQDSTAYRKWWW